MVTLFETIIVLGLVLAGTVYIVHPPAGGEVAKRFGKVAVVLFAIHTALSYLWEDRIGRVLLIVAAMFIVGALVLGRRK